MQVFCEPETNRLPATTTLDRRGSDETSVVHNFFCSLMTIVTFLLSIRFSG